MNTPPTMTTVPMPMAPVKLNRKQANKMDIKPKKLLYLELGDFDQEYETTQDSSVISSVKSLEIQEKSLVKFKEKESSDSTFIAKHVEQNELDNEVEEIENVDSTVEHPYNLRRRNKNPIYQTTQPLPRKTIVKKKLEEEKENIQIDSSCGVSGCTRLSQPSNNLDLGEKLLWLQKRRDVGLWIQCCNKNCKKWRYVELIHDPVNVPEVWFCCMNPNEFYSSCEDPIQESYYLYETDLIENSYNAGSLVWVKLNGFPSWPAMVDDCPEILSYYELKCKSKVPTRYHVTFFEDKPSRAWVPPSRMKPLRENHPIQPTKKSKLVYRGINYTEELEKHLKIAKSAIPLTIEQRLEKYSFLTRYGRENISTIETTTPKRKSKRKKCSRTAKQKSVQKIPLRQRKSPVFEESTVEQNLVPENQTSPVSPDLFEESFEIGCRNTEDDSEIVSKEGAAQKSRPVTPFDKEEALVEIKNFIHTKLYQDHMDLTGRDLFEDTRRRQELLRRMKSQIEESYFYVENDDSNDDSTSNISSICGSQGSNYKYRSCENLFRSKNIYLQPRIVLKRNTHIDTFMEEVFKKRVRIESIY